MTNYAAVAQQGSNNVADLTDTFGDLDAFMASGGKLVTFVGANDALIMPRGVINYYRVMARRYQTPRNADLPPLKWSSLKYVLTMEDEINGEEEA